jgi:hypothetical protein
MGLHRTPPLVSFLVDGWLHGLFIVLMMEAVCTSETSVYFHKTTCHYIPESCHLQQKIRLDTLTS